MSVDGRREGFDRVVVAAGCWVGSLLPAIGAGVRVTHQEMLFIVPEEPERFAHGAFPVWSLDPDGEGWYGFPMLREGYVKVAKDAPGATVDPDVDRGGTPEFEEQALALLRERIPDLASGRVVGGRSCLYTVTPDDHFIVDRAPGLSNVFVAGRWQRARLQVRRLDRPDHSRCRGGRTQPAGRPLPHRGPLRGRRVIGRSVPRIRASCRGFLVPVQPEYAG